MFCTKCGAELSDESKFCCMCGEPVTEQKDTIFDNTPKPAEQPEPEVQESPSSPSAPLEADGIYGIIGFVMSFTVPIAGLILSLIGYLKTRHRGFALAGIVISTVILFAIIVLVAVVLSNVKDPTGPLFILITAIF